LARSESAGGADRDLTRETPTADSEWIEAILEKNEVDHDVLMDALIDEASKTPLFRQIMEQVIGLVDSHALKLGTRLPSTRALAERLGVDRSTVYKAYQELWALGYLDSRPGSYSTVRHLRSM